MGIKDRFWEPHTFLTDFFKTNEDSQQVEAAVWSGVVVGHRYSLQSLAILKEI